MKTKTRTYILLVSALAVLLALWKVSDPTEPGTHSPGELIAAPGGDGGPAALAAPGAEDDASRVPLHTYFSAAELAGDAAALEEVEAEPANPVLRGRVIAAAAQGRGARPIAGASLTYAASQEFSFDLNECTTSAETDEAGRFEIPVEAWGEYPFTVVAEGFLPHTLEIGPVREGLDLGDIPLAQARLVSGKVVDTDGRGIEGARILMDDPCADALDAYRWKPTERPVGHTNAKGEFTVPVSAQSSPGAVWSLVALHDHFRPTQYQGRISGNLQTAQPILITMERGSSIRGRVTGLDAAALQREGPLVVAVAPRIVLDYVADDWFDDPSERRVKVRDDGTFMVAGLGPGESVAVSVWTGGTARSMESRRRSEWSVATAPPGDMPSEPVTLDFVAPVRFRARAVDDAGLPLTSISAGGSVFMQIYASGEQRPIMERATFPNGEVKWVCHAVLTEDGPEVAIKIEDSRGELLKSWSAAAPRLSAGGFHDFGNVTPKDVTQDPSVNAEPVRALLLRALDHNGQPCAGVRFELAEATGEANDFLKAKNADSKGRACLEAPTDRDLRVRINEWSSRRWIGYAHRSHPGVKDRVRWTHVPAGNEQVSIDLTSPDTASVTITVLYAGMPLPGASLVLRWIPPSASASSLRVPRQATPEGERTGGSGTWARDRMIPGSWLAWVYHPQLRMPERFHFSLAPGDNDVTFERASTALTGRVVDANGRPIGGALVRAETAETSPLLAIHERDNYHLTPRLGGTKESVAHRDIRYVRTDQSGAFRLDGVEPGRAIKAIAMSPGFVLVQSKGATLHSGDTVDLGKLTMRRAGRLHVLIPNGSEGDVNVKPTAGRNGDRRPIGPDGERWSSIFGEEVLEGLEPGDWTVQIGHRPSIGKGEPLEILRSVTIREGETTRIDLREQ